MDEDDLDLTPPRRVKLGVIVLVALLHILAILALIRAFAPDFTAQAVETISRTLTVTITAPPPPPEPQAEPKPAGAAGEAGKKAVPREVKAEKPKVEIAKVPAPRASSTGSADTSGARDAGSGTGAGGAGSGTGSGAGGSGQGGGASKPVHISGRIDRATDFPIPPGGREARIGKAVILALTISPEGRATGCRIYKSSGLPDTDEVTCRLAKERLRFKPALNATGEPVTGTFYWQQKFFF
ncbi:MAG: energy transducer TonB [Novosphingobium sp.]|jgi:protein TonB|uniref:energy transducer TonB n=1 Tax=Novosphingobium sp. TaxID=1874826 RepID=UPI003919E7BD|nr:energy transducer TonB [Novosphingobium sp.]